MAVCRQLLIEHFYPRPPRGGRRIRHDHTYQQGLISIHALREEGDLTTMTMYQHKTHFYPRPPRGGRPFLPFNYFCYIKFLSTPSARRATHSASQSNRHQRISIHALREEGDRTTAVCSPRASKFLSTPSARRATTQKRQTWSIFSNFYPRPPRGGRR